MRAWVIPIVLATVLVLITGCQQIQPTQPQPDGETEGPTFPAPPEGSEEDLTDVMTGEVIYVPVYSSVFHEATNPYQLTATLNIHNIDLDNSIRLTKVDYYNTNGELLRNYLQEDMDIHPLQTVQFVVGEDDTQGGTGANFIVEWVSETQVSSPIVEAVMISTRTQQGISFVTSGSVISSLGSSSSTGASH